MSTYTQILYQIVFSTKNRRPTLVKEHRPKPFSYMVGILKQKKCHPYIINNGVGDHVHILTHLHPSIALSDLIKDIKISTSILLKSDQFQSDFEAWQKGYGAFTYSIKSKQNLIKYIDNQENHHRKTDYKEEFIGLLDEHEIPFKEEYLI